ncbi:MAG: hypothetical protein RIS31_959, partial [Actinomycetota bacterium]
MALDSESRWRLVRKLKAQPVVPAGENTIREAKPEDLREIVEIYNYYILNSVITFDIEEHDLAEWQS